MKIRKKITSTFLFTNSVQLILFFKNTFQSSGKYIEACSLLLPKTDEGQHPKLCWTKASLRCVTASKERETTRTKTKCPIPKQVFVGLLLTIC